MCGYKINTCCGPAVVLVQVCTPGYPVGKLAQHTFGAVPVITHTVAVFPVPFAPPGGEFTNLVTAFADVPGFGDQFYLRDNRVLVDNVKKGAQLVYLVQLAGKRSR